ncbi:unnamed protein product, partial [Ceratitis capitata]
MTLADLLRRPLDDLWLNFGIYFWILEITPEISIRKVRTENIFVDVSASDDPELSIQRILRLS